MEQRDRTRRDGHEALSDPLALRLLLAGLGLNQTRAARRAGVSQSHLSRVLRGQRRLDPALVVRLLTEERS